MLTIGSEITSWNDLITSMPDSPLEIIVFAKLAGVTGSFAFEAYQLPVGSWDPCSIIVETDPVCHANETDNLQKVEEAKQWNFSHKTRNDDGSIALPLRRILFMRSGTDWKMKFNISFLDTWSDVKLSFRNNAATRGDEQGTVPVISFGTGSFSGAQEMEISFQQKVGVYTLGLVGTCNAVSQMLEMEFVLVQ